MNSSNIISIVGTCTPNQVAAFAHSVVVLAESAEAVLRQFGVRKLTPELVRSGTNEAWQTFKNNSIFVVGNANDFEPVFRKYFAYALMAAFVLE